MPLPDISRQCCLPDRRFLPAIFVCVIGPLFRPGRTTGASIQTFLAICGGLAILAIFALAAYGFSGRSEPCADPPAVRPRQASPVCQTAAFGSHGRGSRGGR